MTSDQFTKWLEAMRLAGLAKSDRDCGRALELQPNTITKYKRHGAPLVVALACRALLHRLEPYA